MDLINRGARIKLLIVREKSLFRGMSPLAWNIAYLTERLSVYNIIPLNLQFNVVDQLKHFKLNYDEKIGADN